MSGPVVIGGNTTGSASSPNNGLPGPVPVVPGFTIPASGGGVGGGVYQEFGRGGDAA
ncbi:MAG: hypothetical protein LBG84_01380 [Treponema sp.]|nr:hypothetical protein [Treponema sp.]